MERRRVVITGTGMVIPHGRDVEDVWRQIQAGQGKLHRIQGFDPVDMPTQIGGEVLYPVATPDEVGPYPVDSDALRYTVASAQDALAQAGLGRGGDPDRRAVMCATGIGPASLELFGEVAVRHFAPEDDPYADDLAGFYPAMQRDPVTEGLDGFYLDTATPALAVLLGAARAYNTASACASGSHVLADAAQAIRRGEVDVALAAGVCTAVNRAMIPGFSVLQALSRHNEAPEKASRPFDAERDGFVMSNGASALVLEGLDHALARGARILGELVGWGWSTDSYRLTDPHPEGVGMAQAMGRALADAAVDPDQVDYINAHGTSTAYNDAAETLAIKKAFGTDRAYHVPVSSTKSMFGHLIHAAGTTEAIVTLLAMRDGVLPPTINYEHPDPRCDLDYVPNRSRRADARTSVSNSFGFGGQNVSLVLKRWDG
ncbi:beta-ketoacyl-[acyl-carrier-protein] synthase family protein [Myxococcota bacterium]|nr:beta-ketoacyl-[acyl-carrier-protein] synthase family protein [Myxococcota bacterium]